MGSQVTFSPQHQVSLTGASLQINKALDGRCVFQIGKEVTALAPNDVRDLVKTLTTMFPQSIIAG